MAVELPIELPVRFLEMSEFKVLICGDGAIGKVKPVRFGPLVILFLVQTCLLDTLTERNVVNWDNPDCE